MDARLKASLQTLVRIDKRTGQDAWGQPTVSSLGPFKARVEAYRGRTYTPDGESIQLEGMVFLDGPDLPVGVVEPGDTVIVVETQKARAIRLIEPLYDLDRPTVIDHWEITF